MPKPLSDLVGAGQILPRYGGGSIANLPPTIGALLGVDEGWSSPTLAADLIAPLAGDWRRLVLLLVDGIGWNRLLAEVGRDDAGFDELYDRYGLIQEPITSVSPATTSVATTVLLGNGAAPAESGMLGYTFRLPELGVVANALFWKPARHPTAVSGDLERWGLRPETFLPTPSLFQVLAAGGVEGSALLPRSIAASPLARMQLRGKSAVGYEGLSDLFHQLEGWSDHGAGRPAVAYAYYPYFDGISHRDGPDAPSWSALWEAFVFGLKRYLARLPNDTLVLMTADHGHVHTPLAERRTVRDVPGLARHSAHRPAGEARHPYFYARGGHQQAMAGTLAAALGDAFVVLDGEEALASGLYGPPERVHPEADRRIGDVVALARGGASFWDEAPDTELLGMHGSLDPDEMLVPLIAFRGLAGNRGG